MTVSCRYNLMFPPTIQTCVYFERSPERNVDDRSDVRSYCRGSACITSHVTLATSHIDSHLNDRYPNFTIVYSTRIHPLTSTYTMNIPPYYLLQLNNPDSHLLWTPHSVIAVRKCYVIYFIFYFLSTET